MASGTVKSIVRERRHCQFQTKRRSSRKRTFATTAVASAIATTVVTTATPQLLPGMPRARAITTDTISDDDAMRKKRKGCGEEGRGRGEGKKSVRGS